MDTGVEIGIGSILSKSGTPAHDQTQNPDHDMGQMGRVVSGVDLDPNIGSTSCKDETPAHDLSDSEPLIAAAIDDSLYSNLPTPGQLSEENLIHSEPLIASLSDESLYSNESISVHSNTETHCSSEKDIEKGDFQSRLKSQMDVNKMMVFQLIILPCLTYATNW